MIAGNLLVWLYFYLFFREAWCAAAEKEIENISSQCGGLEKTLYDIKDKKKKVKRNMPYHFFL
jgi:hypothetical protein